MKDKSSSDRFLVRPGQTVSLAGFDPADRLSHKDKAAAQEEKDHYARRLRDLQYLLYAEGRRSLLICLQALDVGSKEGTIRHVPGYMNTQGVSGACFQTAHAGGGRP